MVGEMPGLSPEIIAPVPLRMEFGSALEINRTRANAVEQFIARGKPGEAPLIAGVTLTSGQNNEGKPASAIVIFSYPGSESTVPRVYKDNVGEGKKQLCRNVVWGVKEGILQEYADAADVSMFKGKPRISVEVPKEPNDADKPASITFFEKGNPHPITLMLCWSKEGAEKALAEWNVLQTEKFGEGKPAPNPKPLQVIEQFAEIQTSKRGKLSAAARDHLRAALHKVAQKRKGN